MKWIRPSGSEIETNDEKGTIEYCKSLGWKEKGAKEETKKEVKKESKLVSKKKSSKKKA